MAVNKKMGICLILIGWSVSGFCARPRAPFKVLFNNDFSNLQSCTSSYHPKGADVTPEMLRASIDETAEAGVEVHLLQPYTMWVPLWQSRVYPIQTHRRWWKDTYGVDFVTECNFGMKSIVLYILDGGDPVQDFIEHCRKRGVQAFLSTRMNDCHHLENAGNPQKGILEVCQFYAEHPEYRLGVQPHIQRMWLSRILNWQYPEVRQYKFSLIKELIDNYDLDGIELDFMRHWMYFRLDQTTSSQRREIMTAFVKEVRTALDAKEGRYHWLGVRIPSDPVWHDKLGLDVRTLADVGVDMFNLSNSYFTEQQNGAAQIKKQLPDKAVYVEFCHTTRIGLLVNELGRDHKTMGYDNFTFRRTTPLQYYTGAHLAYARGLDGISTFNFVYYREHGAPGRGPFAEPPFEVHRHLGDPQWLAAQPQHYVLGEVSLGNRPLILDRPLPQVLEEGQTATFRMDMAPPAGGWKRDGRLRIQCTEDLGQGQFVARFNGVELEPTSDVSEPYENPYPPLLGTPSMHRGWIVPKDVPVDGINEIQVSLTVPQVKYGTAKIVFVDIAIE